MKISSFLFYYEFSQMKNEAISKIYLNFGAQINDFLQYWKGVPLVWRSFLDSI